MIDFTQFSNKNLSTINYHITTLQKMGVEQDPSVIEALMKENERRENIKKARFSHTRDKIRTEQRNIRISNRNTLLTKE